MPEKPQPKRRIDAIDLTRGVALLAMAIYHFTWDLEFFGYVDQGMTAVGGWKFFARCIASNFLFLAGVSLFLAHADAIRWPGFLRRLAMVAGAAVAISVVTYIATPGGFIFFGILHEIALAAVLGLAFLRLPAVLTLLIAALVIAAPSFLQSDFFNEVWWWWTGLSTAYPRSNDYVPVFPWFGAVLAGMAAAKIARQTGMLTRMARLSFGPSARPALFAGRHSLAFYLLHQPVLIACVWAYAQIMPAVKAPPQEQFLRSCEAACNETRDTEFCRRYCACMTDRLERDQTLDSVMAGEEGAELRAKVENSAEICTGETDDAILEGKPNDER